MIVIINRRINGLFPKHKANSFIPFKGFSLYLSHATQQKEWFLFWFRDKQIIKNKANHIPCGKECTALKNKAAKFVAFLSNKQ